MPIKLQNLAPRLLHPYAQAIIAVKQGIASVGLAYLAENRLRKNKKDEIQDEK